MQNQSLISLQTKCSEDFEQNLHSLISHIENQKKNSIILAPELAISGYSYDNMDKAVEISLKAIPILKELSCDKTIGLTLMEKIENNYFNTFYLFHKGEIKYTQSKVKLFSMNDEDRYFTAGLEEDIKIFEIDGLKIGVLICFELRFVELWQKLQGADLIFVPAMWGAKRKDNFEVLTTALATINQCFVLASGSANDDMAKSSAIISPFGKVTKDDSKDVIISQLNKKEIENMRKHLFVGIEP